LATYERKDYNYRVYDFKSVGERLEQFKQSRRLNDVSRQPIGIKTPVALSHGEAGLLDMHYDLGAQIKDNFRNMLLTNHGERLGHYDFGANLTELAFEFGNENFDNEAMLRIKETVQKYMPFLVLENFEPFKKLLGTSNDLAVVGMRINYSVPAARLKKQQIEVIIYAAG
jgi:phage baseplate assembly protein W